MNVSDLTNVSASLSKLSWAFILITLSKWLEERLHLSLYSPRCLAKLSFVLCDKGICLCRIGMRVMSALQHRDKCSACLAPFISTWRRVSFWGPLPKFVSGRVGHPFPNRLLVFLANGGNSVCPSSLFCSLTSLITALANDVQKVHFLWCCKQAELLFDPGFTNKWWNGPGSWGGVWHWDFHVCTICEHLYSCGGTPGRVWNSKGLTWVAFLGCFMQLIQPEEQWEESIYISSSSFGCSR